MLRLDIEREDIDAAFFYKFLEDFPLSANIMKPKVRDAYIKLNQSHSINIHLFGGYNEEQLARDCISRLFVLPDAPKTLEFLEKYFEEKVLHEIFATVGLLNGGEVNEAEKYLSQSKIK